MKKEFSPKQKALIAMEAIKEQKSMSQIVSEYEVHPVQVDVWKKQLLQGAEKAFTEKESSETKDQQALIDLLYKLVGQRDIELDWLKKNCTLSHEERVGLIEHDHPTLSITRQTELLDISRSSAYYAPRISEADVQAMDALDKIYTDYPFYGSRRMKDELRDSHDISIGRDHVRRLMRLMGLETIYPKKRFKTSESDSSHQRKMFRQHLH